MSLDAGLGRNAGAAHGHPGDCYNFVSIDQNSRFFDRFHGTCHVGGVNLIDSLVKRLCDSPCRPAVGYPTIIIGQFSK